MQNGFKIFERTGEGGRPSGAQNQQNSRASGTLIPKSPEKHTLSPSTWKMAMFVIVFSQGIEAGEGEIREKGWKKQMRKTAKFGDSKILQLDVHICRHTNTYMQKMQFFTFSFRIRIMIDLLEARKISTSFRTSLPLKNSENHHDFFYHHHPSYYPSYHPSYHHFRTKTNMRLPIVDCGKYHWVTQQQR